MKKRKGEYKATFWWMVGNAALFSGSWVGAVHNRHISAFQCLSHLSSSDRVGPLNNDQTLYAMFIHERLLLV